MDYYTRSLLEQARRQEAMREQEMSRLRREARGPQPHRLTLFTLDAFKQGGRAPARRRPRQLARVLAAFVSRVVRLLEPPPTHSDANC